MEDNATRVKHWIRWIKQVCPPTLPRRWWTVVRVRVLLVPSTATATASATTTATATPTATAVTSLESFARVGLLEVGYCNRSTDPRTDGW